MAKITNETCNAWSVTGSSERLLDRAPNGILWFAHNHGEQQLLFWSKDEGNTWTFSGTRMYYHNSYYPRGVHIDQVSRIHSVGRSSNTKLRIHRGIPIDFRGYVFYAYTCRLEFEFSVANEALHPDGGVDIVAWRTGSAGYKNFVLFTTTALVGGVITNTLRLAEITISPAGVYTLTKTSVIRTATGGSVPYGCLTFQHVGDGKTPTATPHVYVVSSVNTPDVTAYRQDDLQLHKFTYDTGNYTQGSAVVLEAAVDTTNRVMRCSYDGTRVVAVYGTVTRATGTSTAAVHLAEWLEATGAVTRHDPTVGYGGGVALSVSSAVDPVTDDVYVAAYGAASATPVWSRYVRASDAWATWQAFGGSLAGWTRSGRISLKQYVAKSSIELVYGTGTANPWASNYTKLTITNTAPSVPKLLTPKPSQVLDLGSNGVTFSWRFVDPDPGDLQNAWQMRRRVGAGAYSYYNLGTQTWQATAVWNLDANQQVSFAAGVWANGNTWAWSVNTRDSGALTSGFAPDQTVIASVSPAVAVTEPAGVYANDSSPVIKWNYVSSVKQRTYQIKIFPLATYSDPAFNPATSTTVWDSGDVPSVQARSARVEATLLNQGTFRAYMRVSDAGGLYSDWAYSEFLLAINASPTPLIQAVVDTDYVSQLGRVRLTIQGVTNYLSGDQAYDHPNGALPYVPAQHEFDTTAGVSGGGNAVWSVDTSWFVHGTGSIRFGAPSGGGNTATAIYPFALNGAGDRCRMYAGGSYTVRCVMNVPVAPSLPGQRRVFVGTVDAQNNINYALAQSAAAGDTVGTYTLTVTCTIPTTAVNVFIRIVNGQTDPAQYVQVDALTVTPTDFVPVSGDTYLQSDAGGTTVAQWQYDGQMYVTVALGTPITGRVVTQNAGQWERTNCDLANSPNGVVVQTLRSLQMTSRAAGDMSIRSYNGIRPIDTTDDIPPAPRDFPARPGQTYTGLCTFTAAATPRNVRTTLTFWAQGATPGVDPDVQIGAAVQGTFLADIVGFPVQAAVTGTCPLGADRVRLTCSVLGVTVAGEVHYLDAIDMHPGTSLVYSPGGLISQQVFTAARVHPDLSTYPVRPITAAQPDRYQRLVAYDREMPFSTDVVYSVQSIIQLTDTQVLASDPSPGALVLVDTDTWAIRDPLDFTAGAEAQAIVTDFEQTREALTTVYRPAGRALALVESQGSTGDDATMVVQAVGVTDRRIIRGILNRQKELIVQAPSGDTWYVWVNSQKPKADYGQSQAISVEYVQVDAP